MLHSIEVLVQRRRASRHAVDLRCDVVTEAWPEPIAHRVRDLGLGGLFVESQLLPDEGSDVLVEMRVGRRAPLRLTLLGKVRRCELRRRASERGRSGFAIELGGLAPYEADTLRDALRGLPPPLPVGRRSEPPREQMWVESIEDEDEELDAAFARAISGELLSAKVPKFTFD